MSTLIYPSNGMYLTDMDNREKIGSHEADLRSLCKGCSAECSKAYGNFLPTVQFITTENCNLNCSYCYETCKTNKKMTKEVAKAGVDFILSDQMFPYFEKESIGGLIVEFFGGEPFLNVEIMDFIADYFYEQCYLKRPEWLSSSMLATSSNGTLYFEPKVQEFCKKHKSHFSLGITIDGDKALHDECRLFYDGRGSYDIVAAAVKDWNKNSHTAATSKVTIAPANLPYIYNAFVHLWEEVGIQFINANCVFEPGWNFEHAQLYYKELMKIANYLLENKRYKRYFTSLLKEFATDIHIKNPSFFDKNFCGGNGSMLCIGTDGKLYTCMRFMDYALNNQEERSIGDVYNGINMDDQFLKDLKNITLTSQIEEECLTCPAVQLCGGCTGFNYDHFGDANKKANYCCDMIKVQALVSTYFYNKIYELEGMDIKLEEPFENIYI